MSINPGDGFLPCRSRDPASSDTRAPRPLENDHDRRNLMRLLLLSLLASSAAADVAVLPLVSYSSGSGLLYGANAHAVFDGNPGGEFSVMAYGTARGGQYESFAARIPGGESTWYLTGEHEQKLGHDFFGWGNWGDPDSSLEYDRETDVISIGRTQTFGPFEARVGAEARHSSVFDREEGELWNGLPGGSISMRWTAGPSVEFRTRSCPIPVWEDLRARFDWQRGGGADYWTTELERVAYLPIRGGTLLALRYDIAYHHGVENTALPFLPFLGPDQLLRGYADDRFSGPWTSVANLEVRRPLFSFLPDPLTMRPLVIVGAALFADAGQASESPGGFRWDRWHPDAGIGLSLAVEGIAVRLDLTALSPEGFHIGMSLGSGDF